VKSDFNKLKKETQGKPWVFLYNTLSDVIFIHLIKPRRSLG